MADGEGEKKINYYILFIYLCYVCVSVKNMGTAKGYMFRVFAHSATSFTSSDEYKYPMPEDIKNRAITAGLVGRYSHDLFPDPDLDPIGVQVIPDPDTV
jgi:hypothetical protein